eukprot:2234953-Amphidinium_carterae.2
MFPTEVLTTALLGTGTMKTTKECCKIMPLCAWLNLLIASSGQAPRPKKMLPLSKQAQRC